MPNVLIYDYGGNTGSLQRALRRLGATFDPPYSHVIYPGQGRWPGIMDYVTGPSMLGICLGFQVLCRGSDEGLGAGIGIFRGWVRKLPVAPLPHIGWNTIEGYEDFYFCHSYAVLESPDAIGYTEYKGCRFVSLMQRGNIWGIQAHPEKSGDAGMAYLERFLKC